VLRLENATAPRWQSNLLLLRRFRSFGGIKVTFFKLNTLLGKKAVL
jgi:hypothetical protein